METESYLYVHACTKPLFYATYLKGLVLSGSPPSLLLPVCVNTLFILSLAYANGNGHEVAAVMCETCVNEFGYTRW